MVWKLNCLGSRTSCITNPESFVNHHGLTVWMGEHNHRPYWSTFIVFLQWNKSFKTSSSLDPLCRGYKLKAGQFFMNVLSPFWAFFHTVSPKSFLFCLCYYISVTKKNEQVSEQSATFLLASTLTGISLQSPTTTDIVGTEDTGERITLSQDLFHRKRWWHIKY